MSGIPGGDGVNERLLLLPLVLLLLFALPASADLPAGVTLQQDIAYGADPAQRFDVYLPPHPQSAPILLMVHGGAWRVGDKTNERVVENKVAALGAPGRHLRFRQLPHDPGG